MASKGSVGWLILAFALAVPGVLFYQWRTHLDLEKKKALSLKVRLQDTDLFHNSPKKDKLVNPISPAGASLAAASTAMQPAPAPAPAAAPTPMAPDLAPARPLAAAPASPAPEPEPAVSSGAVATNIFQAWRDPTLSPHDIVRIEEAAIAKQRALDELKAAAEYKRHPVAKKRPVVDVSKLVVLQGIISTPESGNRAIVNGEMVGTGDLVKTTAGPVKVLRVMSQAVSFVYRDKHFSKSLSR